MKLIHVKDYAELSRRAAEMIAAALAEKPDAVLGLATGSTPIGTYELLAARCAQGALDFSRARTVNLDEYAGLAPSDPQSYRYFMDEHLFNKVNIARENTHVPSGVAADLKAECAAYDALLDSLGGVDLQLLGIGRNGHIGFNEPGCSFTLGTHIVTLTESTREANAANFATPAAVPTHAVTMGIRSILQARKIVLLASGDAKRDILRQAVEGPVTEDVPASILQRHADVTVICDFDWK